MNSLLDQGKQEDTSKSFLEQLVGEGKKFKDQEALAKGKLDADSYVATLEHRLDEMRVDYDKLREESITRARLEELLAQLETRQRESNRDDTLNANKDNQKAPQIDPKEIESLVSTKIVEFENNRKSDNNFQTVQAKIKEAFGTEYETRLKERIDSTGLDVKYVDDLARRSPAAAIKLLGLEPQTQETFRSPPGSSRRNDNFAPTASQKRTWTYYQELKKKNPNIYYDPQITVQMEKDAQDLGEAFRDGDYYSYGQERIT